MLYCLFLLEKVVKGNVLTARSCTLLIPFRASYFCMEKVGEKVVNTLLILDLYWMLNFLGNLAAKGVFKFIICEKNTSCILNRTR